MSKRVAFREGDCVRSEAHPHGIVWFATFTDGSVRNKKTHRTRTRPAQFQRERWREEEHRRWICDRPQDQNSSWKHDHYPWECFEEPSSPHRGRLAL